MDLGSILSGLRSVKSNVQALDRQLATLRDKRDELRDSPPNTEELCEFFARGVDEACEEYNRRLSHWYFGRGALAALPGAQLKTLKGPQLLAVPKTIPVGSPMVPGNIMDHGLADASVLGLTYFMGPIIKAAIPELVATHFGASKGNLRAADRDTKLAAVKADIAKLEGQRAKLVAELDEARSAAG